MAGLITAHRLENSEIRPFAARRRTVSLEHQRHLIAQSAELLEVAPTTWRAISDEEARPSAQAFTSWAKSTTRPSSTRRSTTTVEPQSRECGLGGGVRICEPPKPGNIRRQLENTPIVDVVDHPVPIFVRPI